MGIFSDILLTVDYDRTLTGPDSSIPERNLEAIRYFMENGGSFTVNTGRSVPMSRVFMDKVPVNAPLLLYNGAAAYDVATGEFSQVVPIRLELHQTVAEIREMFPEMTVELQGAAAHYRFWENPAWDAFSDHQLCARGFAAPGDDVGPFLKLAVYGEIRDVTMASLFDASPEELQRMKDAERQLIERYGEYCEICRSATRIIDIQPKGVSKGHSALELKKRLGKKLLVCVGDGENDITMMDAADHAYCPEGSIISHLYENVCACGDGAVADVIYEKIPEILKICP